MQPILCSIAIENVNDFIHHKSINTSHHIKYYPKRMNKPDTLELQKEQFSQFTQQQI